MKRSLEQFDSSLGQEKLDTGSDAANTDEFLESPESNLLIEEKLKAQLDRIETHSENLADADPETKKEFERLTAEFRRKVQATIDACADKLPTNLLHASGLATLTTLSTQQHDMWETSATLASSIILFTTGIQAINALGREIALQRLSYSHKKKLAN